MSTEYYLRLSGDVMTRLRDGYTPETITIGRSSGGWCFALNVYPERGIKGLRSWYELFRRDDNRIFDEYDREISIEEMLHVITKRSWPYRPKFTNKFEEEQYLDRNMAEYGPNGCMRAKLGDRVVGHGAGPWDLWQLDP